MPAEGTLAEAGRKEAERIAAELEAEPGHTHDVTVTLDTEKVEARAGIETTHTSVAAYCRYYWDKTKGWCAGVVGRVTW